MPEEELVEGLVELWQIQMTQVDENEMVPRVVNEPSSSHVPRDSRHSLYSLKIPLAIRWHSTTGSSSEDTIRRAHVMFISLIRLAKPDSEIHLVRSFLFSQLFEGLTVEVLHPE